MAEQMRDIELTTAAEAPGTCPMEGVMAQDTFPPFAFSGGDAPINTISEADVGLVPSPAADDNTVPLTLTFGLGEADEGRIQSAADGPPTGG